MQQVGRVVNLNDLNNRVSSVVVVLRDALEDADTLRRWLSYHGDADLEAIGLTDPDAIYLLRAGVQDIAKLFDVWEGRAAVSPAYDFRQYALKLTGIE